VFEGFAGTPLQDNIDQQGHKDDTTQSFHPILLLEKHRPYVEGVFDELKWFFYHGLLFIFLER